MRKLLLFAALILCTAGGAWWAMHQTEKPALQSRGEAAPAPQQDGATVSSTPVVATPLPQDDAASAAAPSTAPAAAAPMTPVAQSLPERRPAPIVRKGAPAPPLPPDADTGEAVIPEPVAREALAQVGADPDAQLVWETAINDPNLPPDARQNLIEDLNETGFADPKNITPDDLPLIESRIAIIENLAPEAMDDTNDAAFGEAYKDLLEMRAKVGG